MLRELAQATAAQAWVIAVMLFFVALFAGVLWRVLTRDRALDAHCARLPLDDAPASPGPVATDAGHSEEG
jgi:cbb3-type cytochrome oxidase subunit 3